MPPESRRPLLSSALLSRYHVGRARSVAPAASAMTRPPAVPRVTAPIDTGSTKGAGAGAELTIATTAASINTRVRLCTLMLDMI